MRFRNRITAGLVAFTLLAGSFPLGASAADGFVDVPSNHVFADAVHWMAAQGITKGCNPHQGNTRFCPEDRVTRGQMAAFLARAFNLPAGKAAFADTKGHVFAADIAALADAGVTRGCNPPWNDRFCPDDYVTRGQMAAFLVRAFGLNSGSKQFTDTTGHVFAADIAALADAGITMGCNPPANDRFCPDDYVTRGQMAAFLYRAFNGSGSGSVDGPKGRSNAGVGGSQPPAPVCKLDMKSVVPDARIAEHRAAFEAGRITFDDFVAKVLSSGGQFTQWVAADGGSTLQWEMFTIFRDVSTFSDAYFKAILAMQADAANRGLPYGDVILGVKSGCSGHGWPSVSPSVARSRVDSVKVSDDLRKLIDYYANLHLGGANANYGLNALIWELNAYTLQGLLVDTLYQGTKAALPYGKTMNGWHHMFFIEMYLLELKDKYPDEWRELRANGWDVVLAAAWNQAQGVWPEDSAGLTEVYDLIFGKNFKVVSEFTGGLAGTKAPARPK